jgi:hypothetical protein
MVQVISSGRVLKSFGLAMGAIPLQNHLAPHDLEVIPFRQRHFDIHVRVFEILNGLAFQADEMMMVADVRLVSRHFRHGTHFLDQPDFVKSFQSLVNGSQGDHGEPLPDLLVDFFGAGMLFGVVQSLVNGETLVGNLQPMLSQDRNEIFVTVLGHSLAPPLS